MFTVSTSKNTDGFWLAVQQTENGHKISWPAFVQYHDRTFEDFLLSRDVEGDVFRIYVSLAHSFQNQPPGSSRFLCLNVQGSHSADGAGKTQAYVDRRTKAGAELERMLEWGQIYPITAHMAHSRMIKDGIQNVEFRDLIAKHW
jgi:hypothetical protein